MQVSITFCGANALKEYGYKVIPKHGHGGYLFEVQAEDGTLIYSRKKTGRFPEPDDLIELLQAHQAKLDKKKEEKKK
ncbi:hypothetical protein M0811_03540 [Anaeramoeba ignava]|uniref:SelT/SelW/SelH family protein n=1 Tax=Anaeramoeba ignava TaxID=1746090 RepID=A0A9Q0R404_ANAIG|nr:hypothetical protein M0811_03540 [Anaeramoeba ignava]